MNIYRAQGKELIITLAQHEPAESVQVIVNIAVVDDFGEQGITRRKGHAKLAMILDGIHQEIE